MLNAERGTNMTLKELLGDAWKDGMTVEDIETALKDVKLPADQSQEIASLKETISKKNTEAADWKHKYQDTLSEAERKKQEAEEAAKAQAEELAALKKSSAIAGYKASYLAMGYDEKLAEDTANALFDGDNTRLFENQRKHMDAVEKKAREDALRGSGRPGGSGSDGGEQESEAVRLAKSIGQERAEADKAAQAVTDYYLK